MVDLGLAQKTRPALILSAAYSDEDRALITVMSHTTKLRGSKFALSGIGAFSKTRCLRRTKRYDNSGKARSAAARHNPG